MDQLWAPWRLSYVAVPNPEGESECFICSGLSDSNDRAHLIVHRTLRSAVTLNRFPYNNGHLLVAPLAHKGEFSELDESETLDLQQVIGRFVGLLSEAMRPDGYNVGLNLGRVAGAGLPGHLHWHIVPRWNGDTNFMPVLADAKVIPQSLDALYELLSSKLSSPALRRGSVMFKPPNANERDAFLLAPYAMATRLSRGRHFPEPDHPFRPPFQRDRERIIHCSAFRRLMLKTQVLSAATTDHHRTRLTHTLEVAQVSRTIARQLGLQEDLTEAIALSHDLGHPPFGHAGEGALAKCMADHGGFDHNMHALRIVETLESPYPARPGLNLTWEVREAMAHHSRRRDHMAVQEFFAIGEPTLEARVVDAADSLVYDTHDLDDALGVGLITLAELESLHAWRIGAERVRNQSPVWDPERFRKSVVRALIEWQVSDLLAYTQDRIRAERVESLADVRRTPDLVGNSELARQAKSELETFLHDRVYWHPHVRAMAERGQRWIRALFDAYNACPKEMSDRFIRRVREEPLARIVCDFVAGMTDRFARQEYERLFPGPRPV